MNLDEMGVSFKPSARVCRRRTLTKTSEVSDDPGDDEQNCVCPSDGRCCGLQLQVQFSCCLPQHEGACKTGGGKDLNAAHLCLLSQREPGGGRQWCLPELGDRVCKGTDDLQVDTSEFSARM